MKLLTRRTLLRSAAGAALLGPFLREVAAQTAVPARLVLVLECNGFYPVTLLSAAARASLGAGVGASRNFSSTYPKTSFSAGRRTSAPV